MSVAEISRGLPEGVADTGPVAGRYEEILNPEAIEFIAGLHRAFDTGRKRLLGLREGRQAAIALFRGMSTSEDFEAFLTLPAYRLIV